MQTKNLVKTIKSVVKNNSVLPILENVYLNNDKVIFTDLETTVSIPYESGINAVIPAIRFIDCIEMMKLPEFSITGENLVSISEGKRKVSLTSDMPGDFPKQDNLNYYHIGKILESELDYIETALKFVAKDELRPHFTGVHFSTEICATDCHRLYFKPLTHQVGQPFTMPSKTAKTILTIGGEWDIFYVSYKSKTGDESERVKMVNNAGIEVVFIPIDGRFPDYKVVIPEGKGEVNITVDPDEFISELKNAKKFSNKATNMVILSINGKMEISSQDIDFGMEYKNEVSADITKHPEIDLFQIGFNANFLTDILNEIPAKENAKFKFWSPSKATIVNDNFLLMPLMVPNI